jgi:hypothetical protein
MFSQRLFRFRSPERNREVDNRRFALIQKAARTALAEAEAEANGLGARIAKARRALIFLKEHREAENSQPTSDVELGSIERSLLTAEGRLEQLREHISVLSKLEEAASAHRTGPTDQSSQKEHQL